MDTLVRDWLLDPLGLLVIWSALLLVIGRLLRRRTRRGSRRRRSSRPLSGSLLLALLWMAGLAFIAAPAIVNPLVASLEGPLEVGDCPTGTSIVVLGGGIDGQAMEAGRFEAMSPATLSRVAAAARLADAEPDITLTVAGGAIGQVTEARMMASLLERLGVASDRIIEEGRSMSTFDNAREIAALLGASEPSGSPMAPVRLVTSALHMRRAMGTFRQQGIDACAVPVDRIAIRDVPPWALWPQTTALVKFDQWFHEVLALGLYRFRGWL